MEHIALPLKYRPMTFGDVVGQAHVVETLRHALQSGRVANAYLFVGPRGIGKTTLSRIFAKALNCKHESNSIVQPSISDPQPHSPVEPCGRCVNCREIAAGRSIDVTELDAASHNSVEDVRPIIEQAQFAPTNAKYKIYIIDECHMLSKQAWNALLKTLEEPPAHVRFIFATTEGDKVLETIVSRCQRFDLRRISTHDIVARLKHICELEKIEAEEDALLAIARGAEGGMRDALTSLDQLVSFRGSKITEEDALAVFGLVSRRALEDLAGAILKGDTATILASIETFDSAGKNMRRLAAELLIHFRNLVVFQALGAQTDALQATPDQIRVLEAQAKAVDAGRVFRVCDQLADLDAKLRETLSVRTILEMTLLKAARIASTATIEELMRAVKALRGECPAPVDAASVRVPVDAKSVRVPVDAKSVRVPVGAASCRATREVARQETRDASPVEGERQETRDASGDTRQETAHVSRLSSHALTSQVSSSRPEDARQETRDKSPVEDLRRETKVAKAPLSAHPVLEDDKLNDIMKMFPGSTVVDVKAPKPRTH